MDLVYNLRIAMDSSVDRSFQLVEQRIAKINGMPLRVGGRVGGGGSRPGGAGRGSARMRGLTATQKLARRVERDQIRAAKKAEAAGIRAAKKVEAANVRAAKAAARVAKSESAKAAREAIRADKARWRNYTRNAKAAIRAQERAQKVAQSRAGRAVGFVRRSVGGTVGRAATVVGGMASMAGGFVLANGLSGERRLQSKVSDLATQARDTEGAQGLSYKQLKARALGTARAVGVSSGLGQDAVVDSMASVQAVSGRSDLADKLAPYMAQLSNATGADLGDTGAAAGQVLQSVLMQLDGIKDPAKKSAMALKQTMQIMDAVGGQAKIGSIEMRDMATEMAQLMSATSDYKGDVVALTTSLSAMSQTATAGGATNAAQSLTALRNFSADLIKNGSKAKGVYAKAGIDVFERKVVEGPNGQKKVVRSSLRDPMEIILDIMSKTGGDVGKISGMFGKRALKAVQPFQKLYTNAGGGAAGEAAIRGQYKKFRDAGLTPEQRKAAAADRLSDPDRQFNSAMAGLQDAAGKELLPAFTALIPEIVKLTPAIGQAVRMLVRFTEALSKNPIKGVGALILAKLSADILSAGIGSGIKSILTKMFASLAASQAGTTAATTAAGGAGGGALTAGGAAGTAGLGAAGVALAGSLLGGYGGFLQGSDVGKKLGGGRGTQGALGALGAYAGALTPWGAVGTLTDMVMGKNMDATDASRGAGGVTMMQNQGIATTLGGQQMGAAIQMQNQIALNQGGPTDSGATETKAAAAATTAAAELMLQAAQTVRDAGTQLSRVDITAPR